MRTFARVMTSLVISAALAGGLTAVATPAGEHSANGEGTNRYVALRSLLPARAQHFALSSPDLRDRGRIPLDSYAGVFGCTQANTQLRLAWHGAPSATRSYAVTMQDLDAPTNAGFWHWLAWDIPSTTRALGRQLPAGAVPGTNDAGIVGYMGPCPPPGDITHRYQITVYALDVDSLGLASATPPTVAAFTLGGHVLGYGRITGTARR